MIGNNNEILSEYNRMYMVYKRTQERRSHLIESLSKEKTTLANLKRQKRLTMDALAILQHVGRNTQQKLGYRISSLVSLALSAVFSDPYSLEMEFVQRRNQTECDLWLCRRGKKLKPIDATGGGVIDVASFALRTAIWCLNKTRPVFWLDEPFKHLSGDLQDKASEMLKMLVKRLGIQIVVISHADDIIQSADKIFRVTIENGISKVDEIT